MQQGVKKAEAPKFAEEIKNMDYEPLLPVELKLIRWSITIGVLLIAVLVWVSHTFFEA